MDSQVIDSVASQSEEQALVMGEQEEVKAEETLQDAAEAPEVMENAEASEGETPAEERKVYQTKQEVLERVKEVAHGEEAPKKEEVEYLKTVFYKLHIAERDAKQKEYLDAGGDPEAYQVTPDEDEEVFKAEMGIIKERRQQMFREQEAEKEENLKRKLDIIERIKAMLTTPEEANKAYQDFKELEQQWKALERQHLELRDEIVKDGQG